MSVLFQTISIKANTRKEIVEIYPKEYLHSTVVKQQHSGPFMAVACQVLQPLPNLRCRQQQPAEVYVEGRDPVLDGRSKTQKLHKHDQIYHKFT